MRLTPQRRPSRRLRAAGETVSFTANNLRLLVRPQHTAGWQGQTGSIAGTAYSRRIVAARIMAAIVPHWRHNDQAAIIPPPFGEKTAKPAFSPRCGENRRVWRPRITLTPGVNVIHSRHTSLSAGINRRLILRQIKTRRPATFSGRLTQTCHFSDTNTTYLFVLAAPEVAGHLLPTLYLPTG
jgi:hypothetical protein